MSRRPGVVRTTAQNPGVDFENPPKRLTSAEKRAANRKEAEKAAAELRKSRPGPEYVDKPDQGRSKPDLSRFEEKRQLGVQDPNAGAASNRARHIIQGTRAAEISQDVRRYEAHKALVDSPEFQKDLAAGRRVYAAQKFMGSTAGKVVGGAALLAAGAGIYAGVKKRRRAAAYTNMMNSYDKGDVWDNPDEVVAQKEYKAFHDPKGF